MNLAENLCLLGSGFGLCLRFGLLLGFELGLDLLRVFVDVFLSAHLLDLTGHAVGKRTQIIVGNLVGGFLLDFNRLAVNHLGLAFVRNDLSWLLQFTRTDDGGRNNGATGFECQTRRAGMSFVKTSIGAASTFDVNAEQMSVLDDLTGVVQCAK